jgi:hypothetical protein
MLTSARTEIPLKEPLEGELYLAGERVPRGVYRQVETQREIVLDREDTLPGSLDGRVACYELVPRRWKHR